MEHRVESLLAQLTREEKVRLLAGVDGFDLPGVERLGIPRRRTADGPFGVRADGPATLYAGGIALAATWNPELARDVGAAIGRDARARGKHYSLGPAVNLYRSPRCGRNFEYFGEDPCLAARMTAAFVDGLQSQRVSATVKHFVGNEAEYARHRSDARIGARAMREVYLPAFEAAVRESRTGAVMSAYNPVNGTQMSANRALGVDLLKHEWRFDGVLMSDWGGVHEAEGALNGGTDVEMPGPQWFRPEVVLALVREGRVTEATIDDKVRRLLRNAVRFGWLDRTWHEVAAPRDAAAGRAVALQTAREAIVLLKSDRGLLPLDPATVRTVAVIGPNAHPTPAVGGGSAVVPTLATVSVVQGIRDRLGARGVVLHAAGIPSVDELTAGTRWATASDGGEAGLTLELFASHTLEQPAHSTRLERTLRLGEPFSLASLATGSPPDLSALAGDASAPLAARWTGWYTPEAAGAHDVVVQLGGFMEAGWRLRVDGALVADRWSRHDAVLEAVAVELDARPHELVLEYRTVPGLGSPMLRAGVVRRDAWVDEHALALARRADAVVLAVGFDERSETENWDRTWTLPPGQDELIARVLDANPNVVVVLTAGGGVDMTRWIDRAPAVLHAWYAGQEGGAALAALLFGDANPSGRLPITLERRLDDRASHRHYYPMPGTDRVEYAEEVFVGYRGFDRDGIAPLFPFGHGLSYTRFELTNLEIAPVPGTRGALAEWSVGFDATNVGDRTGATVAQLYVGHPRARVERPAKELKGFAKVMLHPGETQRIHLTLDARALAFFDVESNVWRAEAGEFDILVGLSSADIALRGELVLEHDIVIPLTSAG